MLPLLIALVTAEEPAPMIAPAWVFAVIAASVFILLAIVTWSFRDVANRHSDKTSATDHQSSHH